MNLCGKCYIVNNNMVKIPPIVAITAHVSEEEKEQITDQGVKDIIAKPINLTMIKTIVDFYVLQGGFVEDE